MRSTIRSEPSEAQGSAQLNPTGAKPDGAYFSAASRCCREGGGIKLGDS